MEAMVMSTNTRSSALTDAVRRLVDRLDAEDLGVHALSVFHDGESVADAMWAPYRADVRQIMFSVSKSFTSAAVGLARADALLDLDDTIVSRFPEHAATAHPTARALTVRHLLSMSTGHDRDTMGLMRTQPPGDWPAIFLAEPVHHEPGTRFLYDSGASYVLSALITRVSGLTLEEYLAPRLFEPLQIANPPWQTNAAGVSLGASGLRLTTAELARFGQLLLQQGRYDGEQVLPIGWVEEATAAQVATDREREADWKLGYGYQFWRSRHDSFRADGAYGQFCLVVPSAGLVVAITSGSLTTAPIVSAVWDELLPHANLPNAEADPARRTTSFVRSLPWPGAPQPARTPVEREVMASNSLGISGVTIEFESDAVTLVARGTLHEIIHAPYRRWADGTTNLWPHEELASPVTASSAGWVDDGTLEVVQHLIETPFHRRWRFIFDENGLLLSGSVELVPGFWQRNEEVLF